MTALEQLEVERTEIRNKLKTIDLPKDKAAYICWIVGDSFNVSGSTIKNYLAGKIPDGLLAIAIYKEFKRLKYIKK